MRPLPLLVLLDFVQTDFVKLSMVLPLVIVLLAISLVQSVRLWLTTVLRVHARMVVTAPTVLILVLTLVLAPLVSLYPLVPTVRLVVLAATVKPVRILLLVSPLHACPMISNGSL